MVEAGAGIGLLTDLAIDNDDPLIQHSILFDAPLSFNVYLAYRSSHILSPIEKKNRLNLCQLKSLRNLVG